jgi:hypothetical protein
LSSKQEQHTVWRPLWEYKGRGGGGKGGPPRGIALQNVLMHVKIVSPNLRFSYLLYLPSHLTPQ